MGHQDQDGEKVGQMSLFFKSPRLLRTEKIKNSYTFKSYYLILASGVLKIWVSGIRHNLGCTRYAQSWVFFQKFQNTAFCCFITRLVKKLQHWSLYEVIEDILLFILNTKLPLSNIWLLSYEQNNLSPQVIQAKKVFIQNWFYFWPAGKKLTCTKSLPWASFEYLCLQ